MLSFQSVVRRLTKYIHHYARQYRLKRRHIIYGVLVVALLLVSSFSLLTLSPYRSQAAPNHFFRAKVVLVQNVQSDEGGAGQLVKVRLLDGPQKHQLVTVSRSVTLGDAAEKRLPVGSEVLLSKDSGQNGYGFVSRWYMPGIATLFVVLLLLVVLIGGWRGITSVLGLAISICILTAYVVPRILAGQNAFTTCIEAAVAITLVSIYVAHGISRRTTVAFLASVVSLALVVGLTGLASYITGTSEVIDENNVNILYAAHPIDLSGLLTGGVVIASLGTLFDITTGQAATVDEIHKADPTQTTGKLFVKGMSVGREHIAALINTLALVYAGVALPLIITTAFYAQDAVYSHLPLVVRLNTETVAEEAMRTCVSSIAMLLALPITTWLAAYLLPRWMYTVDTTTVRHWRHTH